MKKIVIRKVLFGLMFMFLSGSAFAQQVKAIFIEWQDFATLTFYSIPCDQFRSQFEETKETKKIVDKASIAKYLTQTKFFSIEKGIEQLGIRGIITFQFKSLKVEYCFDKFGNFYKNGVIYRNDRLFELIKDAIETSRSNK
jgi:hypothetical protein